MGNNDSFDGSRPPRRHGLTAAGLAAAILSVLLYQCVGKNSSQPTIARHDVAPPARANPRDQARVAAVSFDFYLLALSLAPAFCADGHENRGECRALDAQSFAATPLTLHGLWPENQRANTYPADCNGGTGLELSAGTRAAMTRWMPGAADGLATHEWSAHGACTGLNADDYFMAAMRFTEQANAALGPAIRNAAGGNVEAASLRAAANTALPGYGDRVFFVCRNLRGAPEDQRRRPHLREVRACVDNDGPGGAPKTLLRCVDVQRRDQGCGASFQIDAPPSRG